MAVKDPQSVEALRQMAKDYRMDGNALVMATIEQYAIQQRAILAIKEIIDEEDLTTTKEYVKGRKNLYAHPALKELPRHTDAANKTADLIHKYIITLGTPPQKEGKLSMLAAE